MSKLQNLFSHLTVILAIMFIVFLILDQFNPMMNFVNNQISIVLLICLSVLGIAQSILQWMNEERSYRV